ncbi:hypothetical protein JCM5350_002326 [Sporobolomyces pararoseus]
MSFSALPPEVVHQIIESTVTHSFHSKTYRERQQTFCSLSLVSKLFNSIAQPLLFEIVNLKTIDDARKMPTWHPFGGNARTNGEVRWLVIEWDDPEFEARMPEEDQLAEYLKFLATARKLTTSYFVPLDFTNWFSTISQPVPNLRNFAFVDYNPASINHLTGSRCNHLLPQLETLGLSAPLWAHPQAAFIHSTVSRTLVDFDVNDTRRLRKLEVPLSIYLDSSLNTPGTVPAAIRTALEALTRICEERKIDLIYERSRFDRGIDPYISSEFVWRELQKRKREAEV